MQTTSVATPAASASATLASKADSTALNSDFDTFLRLMTVQLRNQDPLNPVDSADYAMQLATYSGVEQQIKTNNLLEGLTTQINLLDMAQLSGWIGQEARSAAPVLVDGHAVDLTYTPASGADRAVLVAADQNGAIVAREDVSLDGRSYSWTGTAITGDPLPAGIYSLQLESYRGDEELGEPTEIESYARILEARSDGTGTMLLLQGGIEVPATAVTALRAP